MSFSSGLATSKSSMTKEEILVEASRIISKDRNLSMRLADESNAGAVTISNWGAQRGRSPSTAVSELGMATALNSICTVYPNVKPTPTTGFAIYIKPSKY